MSEDNWNKEFDEIKKEVAEEDKVKKEKFMHKEDYTGDALKKKVDDLLHPEGEERVEYVFVDPEVQRKKDQKIHLDILRDKIKRQFPRLKIKETPKDIASIRNNKKCLSCRFYVTQSPMSKVKEKINKTGVPGWEDFLIRMYKNKNDLLETSRGLCAMPISMSRHIKFFINRPDLSLCSDYQLHYDLETFFDALGKLFKEHEEAKRQKLQEVRDDKIRKEKAQAIIDSVNQKYTKRGKGRPSKESLNIIEAFNDR